MDYLEELRKRSRERLALPLKELPVIRTLGVKYARAMEKEGQPKVLAFLWEDGSITSCAFDSKNDVECCHSEMNGGNEAYWAWIAHLSAKGYKEMPIEVEQ